jgi:hypothetical protein
MRFIAWNLAISAWLLIASFALPRTPASLVLTTVLAVLAGTFAFASRGLPGLRFFITAFALVLGWAALLVPDLAWVTRVHDGIAAAFLFALSVVPGRSGSPAPAPAAEP